MDLKLPLVGLDILTVDLRDKFNEVEALSGWKFDDTLRGDDVGPADRGGGGFVGLRRARPGRRRPDRGTRPRSSTPILTRDSAVIAAARPSAYCPLSGPAWGEGNILARRLRQRHARGSRRQRHHRRRPLRLRPHRRPRRPGSIRASETGTTDLMEHAALSGNFGAGHAPGMTLQQAVFAGIVDPGNLVIVRELLTDADRPTRHGRRLDAVAPVLRGPAQRPSEYLITDNGDGSVTVDHQGGVDGVDTLWNIELLRFCNAVDANGVCIAFVDAPATRVGVRRRPRPRCRPVPSRSAPLTVGTGPARRPSPSRTPAAARSTSPASR